MTCFDVLKSVQYYPRNQHFDTLIFSKTIYIWRFLSHPYGTAESGQHSIHTCHYVFNLEIILIIIIIPDCFIL